MSLAAEPHPSPPTGDIEPVLRLQDGALAYGSRTLWSGLDLDVVPGEFVAVLGANGSGKTSLLQVLLGMLPLTAGTLTLAGRPVRRGNEAIGYVQQQRRIDPLTPLRGRDIVRQGLVGHRWGTGLRRRSTAARVDAALAEVGATEYADMPVGLLSGGEQQRLRVAQALVGDPAVLLCDEPLLSLDQNSQRGITALIDEQRRRRGTAVVFVTHEINPVLPYADRVLYLAGGRFRVGTVDTVLTSETLSELYGVPVEVIRTRGRILVAGLPQDAQSQEHQHDADVLQ
ncbi:zinc/manganese transport system ATP-binding protein [Jatrophihabitans endophyticus]|uniref:Zinc/manganese transport system ATP-binding protein n=1 Tax=Jatrophihabitans endophyticus TaxID=1206085 RepID=A0A1M5EFB8_9ACTN|nr:ABC transporter ATP-binding protein [Jatrophihabitans endophyticus]SHF77834.1 zinc/manganese transport system ATP-binding protein [Jatrophihabitans endophyticus]